ncbi:hypothetical protein, partial [Thermobifida halotolerans]|uniref:hypothetical protein n=1 Tax=Thermobifida halotolerans TaxID=483545 RepID=UPI001F2456B1
MSDGRQPVGRSGAADRDRPSAAPADPAPRRADLDIPVAEQAQQNTGVVGAAVLEVLTAFLRGGVRPGRRSGRRARSWDGMAVLAAGALLARALRNRAARSGTEGGQVVHVANPRTANPVNVEIARAARAGTGDRRLTEAIRVAAARDPGIPPRIREHVAGPDGDRTVDGVLATMDVRSVAMSLRHVRRQEELITRVSEQWNDGLGFEGAFEDAWRYAVVNPAVGDPDGAGLSGHPQGSWRRFAEWDPATAPTDDLVNHLNAAWLSAIASLDTEAAGARRRVETLVARWEPQLYEASTRWLMREAVWTGWNSVDAAALDRVSAAENAALYAGDVAASADGAPLSLTEQWARVTTSPNGLREMEKREIRDLLDAWTAHGGLGETAPTVLVEPALRSLAEFGDRLLEANREAGVEFLERLEDTREPLRAFVEVSRNFDGHPFDPAARPLPERRGGGG